MEYDWISDVRKVFGAFTSTPIIACVEIEWVKQVTVFIVAKAVLNRRTIIWDPCGRLRVIPLNFLTDDILEKIHIITGMGVETALLNYDNLIVYVPAFLEEVEPILNTAMYMASRRRPVVVLDKRRRIYTERARRFLKVYIRRVRDNVFQFRSKLHSCLLEITGRDVKRHHIRLSRIEKTVLDIIRRTLIEYGPLSKNDIIPVIEHETGLRRGKIQEIILSLIRKGALVKEGNSVYPIT